MTDPLDEVLQRGYRYAFSLANDREEARDLIQEACLRIAQRGGPWNLPYLLTVVRNIFIDERRRRRVLSFRPLEEANAVSSPSVIPDPDLGTALQSLGSLERELLFLSVVEGYTAAEIAHHTGRPRGTILSALHRTKAKLRQWWRERAEETA
jgi:RNA polymerase sigma-70 factor (ECF subfamily)